MSSRFQVRKSRRERWPYCQPEYTVNGSFAGIWTHMPSPPFTGYQSSSVIPSDKDWYPVNGGDGMWVQIPSPPFTGYQSSSVIPSVSRVRLGPHHTPLSCSPPHT